MSAESYGGGWTGDQVVVREVCCSVEVCDDYERNFLFVRGVPVYLRVVVGESLIAVEDMSGRELGWLNDADYEYFMRVMEKFRY